PRGSDGTRLELRYPVYPPEPMTPRHWRRLQRLFQVTADLSPEQRAATLDRETAGDDALRAEVEALLRAKDDAAVFFRDLARALPEPLAPPPCLPADASPSGLPPPG
ncbi:MAG: hypothetical protein AAFQ43_10680, partial [Bacteroidota bacterium]